MFKKRKKNITIIFVFLRDLYQSKRTNQILKVWFKSVKDLAWTFIDKTWKSLFLPKFPCCTFGRRPDHHLSVRRRRNFFNNFTCFILFRNLFNNLTINCWENRWSGPSYDYGSALIVITLVIGILPSKVHIS